MSRRAALVCRCCLTALRAAAAARRLRGRTPAAGRRHARAARRRQRRCSIEVVGRARPRRAARNCIAGLAEAASAALAAFGRFPLRRRARSASSRVDSRDAQPGAVGPDLAPRRRVGAAVRARATRASTNCAATGPRCTNCRTCSIPTSARDGRWLAEGLASYYQNVLRARAGLLDAGRGVAAAGCRLRPRPPRGQRPAAATN